MPDYRQSMSLPRQEIERLIREQESARMGPPTLPAAPPPEPRMGG